MRTETVSFPGPDRKTIHCLVYRPEEAQTARATVFLVPGRPLFPTDYEWLIEPLVGEGLVVVGVFQRGYGSDGVDDRAGPKSVATLRKAVATLVEKAGVPEPIALLGHSTGAQTVLLAAAQERRFRTVVALSPLADLGAHVQALRAYLPAVEEEHSRLFGEVLEDLDEGYRVRSPVHVADRIEAPVLLVSGERDAVAPTYHAEALRDVLAGRAAEVRCVVVPWLGHWFEPVGFHGPQVDVVVEETVRWLDTHLPRLDRTSREPAASGSPRIAPQPGYATGAAAAATAEE